MLRVTYKIQDHKKKRSIFIHHILGIIEILPDCDLVLLNNNSFNTPKHVLKQGSLKDLLVLDV